MKKWIPIVVILALFTSCIEIVEEIHIHNDKSGSLTYKLESNQFGYILNKLSGIIELSFEEQMADKAQEIASLLQQKDGIENVVFTIDPYTHDYMLKFDFLNTKKLNAALYDVFGYEKKWFSPGYIKVCSHRVKKINFSPLLQDFLEDEGIEIPSTYLSEAIYFRSTIRVPREVKKVKGSHVKIAHDKKEVNQKFRFTDIVENKVDVGNKIRY